MSKEGWWSERILFGLLIIVGYLGIVVGTMFIKPEQSSNAKDALLVIGPLLGVIVNSIWKTDRADKQNAQAMATLATVAAAAVPAAVTATPAAPDSPASAPATSRFP